MRLSISFRFSKNIFGHSMSSPIICILVTCHLSSISLCPFNVKFPLLVSTFLVCYLVLFSFPYLLISIWTNTNCFCTQTLSWKHFLAFICCLICQLSQEKIYLVIVESTLNVIKCSPCFVEHVLANKISIDIINFIILLLDSFFLQTMS